jgi:hypothetical protein
MCHETDLARTGEDVTTVVGEYPCSRAENESSGVAARFSTGDRSTSAR